MRALACCLCLLVVSVCASAQEAAPGPRTVLSLDGVWQVAEGGMDVEPASFGHTVPVPGLMDLAEPAFGEVGVASARRQAFWYQRTFTVPGPARPTAWLKINKAQFGTKVWLNGVELGEHFGCCTPGHLDVAGALRYGAQNTLVVRVGAFKTDVPAWVPTNTDYEEGKWIPGIYDSVSLTLAGNPAIARVQVAPEIATSSALVQVALDCRGAEARRVQLRVSAREWRSGAPAGAAVESAVAVAPGERVVTVRLRLGKAHLWSPEDPFLYVVRCETGEDAVEARFGMREFRYDPDKGRAILNGRPYFLRGTDFCMDRFAEDPIRGALPWDHEWVRKLLTLPKETMHWNSARVCIAPFPEFWYDLADEIGWILQDEFPIWGFNDAWSQDELQTEFREWMQERWNHPSVAVWDACNETLTPRTGEAIAAVRDLDLSHRPWDNGYCPPGQPGDMVEHHPYTTLGSGAAWDPSALGSARDRDISIRTDGPVVLNEFDTFWLQRNGDLTGGYAGFFNANLPPGASVDDRRELLAYDGAAVSEYWRARRDAAGVQWFCYLTYSRPGAVTSDNFIDLRDLVLEPLFAKYVGDAYAPLGVMVDDATPRVPPGPRDYPIIITNDLYEAQHGKLCVEVTDAGEQAVLWQREEPFAVEALGQSVVSVPVALPTTPGKVRVLARLEPESGVPVTSRRKVEVVSAAEARRLVNVARGCPATASSEILDSRGNCPAKYATDGKLGTRWSSEFADNQWLQVDLGRERTISRVLLTWEAAYGKSYALETSLDGMSWREVWSQQNGQGGREEASFAPTKARYVRLDCRTRPREWGFSLWELQAFED
jgi:beta-galactosidase